MAISLDSAHEKYKIRREAVADVVRIVEGVAAGDGHVILLSDYEVANLRAALQACGYAIAGERSPLDVLNNGDWLGQIWQKLPHLDYKPNAEPLELMRRAREWRG